MEIRPYVLGEDSAVSLRSLIIKNEKHVRIGSDFSIKINPFRNSYFGCTYLSGCFIDSGEEDNIIIILEDKWHVLEYHNDNTVGEYDLAHDFLLHFIPHLKDNPHMTVEEMYLFFDVLTKI